MSNALTLARPYARAAFELAKGEQAAAAWSAKLGFAAAAMRDGAVAQLVANPKIASAERVGLLLPPDEAAASSFSRFVHLLESNQRLSLLPEIASLYEHLRADDERSLRVRVRTALPIDAVQQQQLAGALAKRFDRVVSLDVVMDADLIGGAVVEAGDVVIDGSVRGKLARLRTELAQ